MAKKKIYEVTWVETHSKSFRFETTEEEKRAFDLLHTSDWAKVEILDPGMSCAQTDDILVDASECGLEISLCSSETEPVFQLKAKGGEVLLEANPKVTHIRNIKNALAGFEFAAVETLNPTCGEIRDLKKALESVPTHVIWNPSGVGIYLTPEAAASLYELQTKDMELVPTPVSTYSSRALLESFRRLYRSDETRGISYLGTRHDPRLYEAMLDFGVYPDKENERAYMAANKFFPHPTGIVDIKEWQYHLGLQQSKGGYREVVVPGESDRVQTFWI